jgi:hypothetical protein
MFCLQLPLDAIASGCSVTRRLRMFKKLLLAGAALALTTSVAAADTFTTGPQSLSPTNSDILTTFSLAGGLYNETFSWGGLSESPSTSVAQGLYFFLWDNSFNNALSSYVVTYPTASGSTTYGSLSLPGGTL